MADPGKPRKARAAAAKPARPDASTLIHVDSHRALLRERSAMVEALSKRPELLPLLLANPVLAFRDAGVRFAPAIASHVLHALQYPPAVRAELTELTDQLHAALDELPKPKNPAWLAGAVFDRLEVAPLRTSGLRPAYVSATPPDARARLEALLPQRERMVLPDVPEGAARRQPLMRLDLDAPLVDCPPAKTRPKTLTLEALWFYRGRHELIRPLLRLGVIQSSGMPFLGAESYRKAKSGERPNALVGWVEQVSFPKPPPRKAKG